MHCQTSSRGIKSQALGILVTTGKLCFLSLLLPRQSRAFEFNSVLFEISVPSEILDLFGTHVKEHGASGIEPTCNRS